MQRLLKQKNTGFTLVETLIAISIFTTSILGLIVVLSKSISDTTYAKQKLIASYLAQEGIEYIRNMRDTFMLYPDAAFSEGNFMDAWNNFNTKLTDASCQDASVGCYFDSPNLFSGPPRRIISGTVFEACPVSGCPHLFYDPTRGEYQYANIILPAVDSGFVRKITISQPSSNETVISSTVFWQQGSGSYNITFSEHLFSWIE